MKKMIGNNIEKVNCFCLMVYTNEHKALIIQYIAKTNIAGIVIFGLSTSNNIRLSRYKTNKGGTSCLKVAGLPILIFTNGL